MLSTPKLTIITVVYNGEQLIGRTIKSITEQSYSNIEYIIIDGASKDSTISVIEKYVTSISKVVSEKDNGIDDAMNKGLKYATGDYVLFINAGDELFDKSTIQKVFSISTSADVYYGNTVAVNVKQEILGDRWLAPPHNLNWKSFKFGMTVSHQSFIAKRVLCDNYNLKYSLASDIDWIIN